MNARPETIWLGYCRTGGRLILREDELRPGINTLGTGADNIAASMVATQGEALGQRITETVQGGQQQVLLVASVGNPPVELSRAQLRAVSRIYE